MEDSSLKHCSRRWTVIQGCRRVENVIGGHRRQGNSFVSAGLGDDFVVARGRDGVRRAGNLAGEWRGWVELGGTGRR